MTIAARLGSAMLVALATFGIGLAAADSAQARPEAAGKGAAPVATKSVGGIEVVEYVPEPTEPTRAGSSMSRPSGRSLLGAPSGPSEIEPNGTFGTATAIASGQTVLAGNVYPANDVDFFSFTAAAGDRIYAATQTLFDASGTGDSVLDLLGTDGATVLENDPNDGTFNASSSSIAGFLIPAPGTYFLRVRQNTTGTIRPYALHFRNQSVAPQAEVEPNNTIATATPLPVSRHVSGTITAVSPGEADFYSLTLSAGDSVFLSLDMNPERDATVWNGRLGFGLFGNAPADQILVANDGNAGASAADPNSEAFFFTVKDAGTYFVYVDSTVAAGLGASATYNLSVSVLPRQTPAGTCTTYTSTNVPVAIPTGPGLVTSTLTVPGNPRIADIDVSINLNHTFMQDLDVHLTSPAGNDNGLFTDIGAGTVGGLQTRMDLVIDDEAALPPSFVMSTPFHIQPESAFRLSWFDGEDAGGTWTLTLRDDLSGDGGTLNSWSIRICEPPPPPTCAAGFIQTTVYSTDFESGAAGFTHSGAQDEWELGLPTFVPITTCASGTNCFKTDLDNTYNASSTQDLLSPNINLAGLQPPVLVNWSQRYHMESASFDHYDVTAREVGGANPVRLFDWLDATMNNTVGSPTATIAQSSGWSRISRRVDSLANTNAELLFHVDSDTTIQLAGVAIDDVSVTACRAASADLAITKTDGVTQVNAGGSTTYTITASNAGPDPASPVTVADTFPAACTSVNWTCVGAGGASCAAGGTGNINDTTVNLPVGGTATYTATCAISVAAVGTLSNTATISGGAIADPNPANNSATDVDTVLANQANLSITKTNGVANSVPGTPTTYTITASNAGPSADPAALVTDTFPATLSGVTWTCVGAGGATCPANGAGNINATVNLPVGGSVTFSATGTIAAGATGTLSNTATVATGAPITDPDPANNSATDTDTLTAQADFSIQLNDSPDPVIAGTNLTYTAIATNGGPSDASSAAVSLPLPAGTTLVTASADGGGSCTGTTTVSCTWGATLVGQARTATVTVLVAASQLANLSATATVSSATTDPNGANNSATQATVVQTQADLSITLTDSPDPVIAGTNLTYVATATNNGPSDAQNLAISLPLPPNTTLVSATGGTCVGTTCTFAGATAPGTQRTVTYVVLVAASVLDGSVITATANVTSTTTDPNPANNSATTTTNVIARADLQIGLSASTLQVLINVPVTFTATSTNLGPSDAQNVSVTITLTPDFRYSSHTFTAAGATCTTPQIGTTGAITCTWAGPTAPGVVRTLNVVAYSNNEGNTAVNASTTSNTTDPVPGNNAAGLAVVVGFPFNEIPTLGQWGLLLLGLLMAGVGFVALRRQG